MSPHRCRVDVRHRHAHLEPVGVRDFDQRLAERRVISGRRGDAQHRSTEWRVQCRVVEVELRAVECRQCLLDARFLLRDLIRKIREREPMRLIFDRCGAGLVGHFVEQRLRDHAFFEQPLISAQLGLRDVALRLKVAGALLRQIPLCLHAHQYRAFASELRLALAHRQFERGPVESDQNVAFRHPLALVYCHRCNVRDEIRLNARHPRRLDFAERTEHRRQRGRRDRQHRHRPRFLFGDSAVPPMVRSQR